MKRKKAILLMMGILTSFGTGFYLNTISAQQTKTSAQSSQFTNQQSNMKLGVFSMSLSVKNLDSSKQFYQNLGFTVLSGSMEQHYLIMKNGNALIGLFYGMFKGNIFTFNPGWDENARNIGKFDDVREIQQQLKSKGIKLMTEADEKTSGPASLMLTDPDGNTILIDQHR